MGDWIPIIYYGTEQGFNGGSDPSNRESLWPYMSTEHPLYKFIQKLAQFSWQRIHLIPKWRPIHCSFVCMLISPLRLVNMYKKQKNFEVKMRRKGLIHMQTKKQFIGRHFGIRCMVATKTGKINSVVLRRIMLRTAGFIMHIFATCFQAITVQSNCYANFALIKGQCEA